MKVDQPRLPVQLEDVTVAELTVDAVFEGIRLTGLVPHDTIASNISLDECILAKPQLVASQMPKITLRDCKVKGGDWSAANLSEGGLQRVVFEEVRLTGTDFSRMTLKNVTFVGCKLDMANFRFAKLTNARFEDCNLTEADFQNATVKNMRFMACAMERTAFFAITATNVDLRSSQLLDIQDWRDAKGFKIDSEQLIHIAPQLAASLDISVDYE